MTQIHFVVVYDTESKTFSIDDETLMAWKGTDSWFDADTQTWVKPDEDGEALDWDINCQLGNILGLHNGNATEGALTYFAQDGNYGDASQLAIVDTTDFTEDDWETVEGEMDWHKGETARDIANSKK